MAPELVSDRDPLELDDWEEQELRERALRDGNLNEEELQLLGEALVATRRAVNGTPHLNLPTYHALKAQVSLLKMYARDRRSPLRSAG